MKVIDEFLTANGKRKITLEHHPRRDKAFLIVVRIPRDAYGQRTWVVLSTAEYALPERARHDFERRRPQMHEELTEVPMQRGKRVVQEMLTEKLGSKK